jgi:two-component sensor histidine kinase
MQVSWAGAGLAMIIRNATEPYDNQGVGRFAVAGPEIDVASGAVIALAMTLNELCTNATKFGALSVPKGQVRIAWRATGERLHFEWAETGGPLVIEPTRRSFGTRMITSLGQQLKGAAELEYNPGGFIYRMEVPLDAVTIKAEGHGVEA